MNKIYEKLFTINVIILKLLPVAFLLAMFVIFVPYKIIYHNFTHSKNKIDIQVASVDYEVIDDNQFNYWTGENEYHLEVTLNYDVLNKNPVDLAGLKFTTTFTDEETSDYVVINTEWGENMYVNTKGYYELNGVTYYEEYDTCPTNVDKYIPVTCSFEKDELDNTALTKLLNSEITSLNIETEVKKGRFIDNGTFEDNSENLCVLAVICIVVIAIVCGVFTGGISIPSIGGAVSNIDTKSIRKGNALNRMKSWNKQATDYKNAGLHNDANRAKMYAENAFVDAVSDDVELNKKFRSYSSMETNYRNAGLNNEANRSQMLKENTLSDIAGKTRGNEHE